MCVFLRIFSLSPSGGNGSSSGNLSSNTSSLNANVCNTKQRRRKGSISSVETSEESMDSDNGDSNSVSRDISPTNERTFAVNNVQNDQIPAIDDVEENTIIIIDDSPDENEPVRAPLVSHTTPIFGVFFLKCSFHFNVGFRYHVSKFIFYRFFHPQNSKQMEVPRHKHQTQPLYTAPRLSDRFDRVSPLNSRRSNTDSYHDNKSVSLQNQRQNNKSLRRHSTNAYTSGSNASASHKEISPTSSMQQSQLQQQMNNNSSRLV